MILDKHLFRELKELARCNVIPKMVLDNNIEDNDKMVPNINNYIFGTPVLFQRTIKWTIQEDQPCTDCIEKDFYAILTTTRDAIVKTKGMYTEDIQRMRSGHHERTVFNFIKDRIIQPSAMALDGFKDFAKNMKTKKGIDLMKLDVDIDIVKDLNMELMGDDTD